MNRALRILLIMGVVVLAGSLLAIFVQLDGVHADLERTFFRTERETGFLIEKVPWHERFGFLLRRIDSSNESVPEFSALGLFGVLLVGGAARRIGRRSGVPLGLIAGSVLLPVTIGLVAGLLSLWKYDGLLDALTGRSLPDCGGCVRALTSCSRVQAIELIWTPTVVIACVLTAAIFVLAARRAWVIGERGTRLPRGWAIAAMALFGIGTMSLIASVPYAADHARAARECTHGPNSSIPNSTSNELHGVMVERCDADGQLETALVGQVQAFPDGWVSELPEGRPVEFFTPDQLATHVGFEIEKIHQVREARGEPPPADAELSIALYIDERTPSAAIDEHLRAVQALGVTTIVLYGQTHVEGSLESVGSWTRRNLCPIAAVRLDDDAPELGSFETWGEIITQAIDRGPEPLHLQLGAP